MNDKIGDAFFSFLHTVDLTNYKDQVFPKTKSKEDAVAKRLESVARFVKERYILHSRDLVCSLQYLHDEYGTFCVNNGLKKECKIEMNSRLAKYKMVSFKSGKDRNKFNIKFDDLTRIAKNNKWLHDTDEYLFHTDVFDDLVDQGLSSMTKPEPTEVCILKKENGYLHEKLKELEAQLEQEKLKAFEAPQQKQETLTTEDEQSTSGSEDEDEEVVDTKPRITRPLSTRFEIDLDGEFDAILHSI